MGNRNSSNRSSGPNYGGRNSRMRNHSPIMQQQNMQYSSDDIEYGTPQQPKTPFNDDEEIAMFEGKVEKLQNIDLKQILRLEVKSTQKVIKLSSKADQHIPVMVSLKSTEQKKKEKAPESEQKTQSAKQPKLNKGARPGIDLICVIDVSGSMSGQKIELVKKSMSYLLELLSENDRLSIITFQNYAERLCPLLKVSPKNLERFEKHIASLSGRGGTNINSGMQLALRTLDEKKYKNNVESIFLLSDGIDGGADQRVQMNVNKRIDLMKKSAYSIHTFGYGSDHDPKLMKNIANFRDGNFFYIDKLETLDEAFASCLGGLFSVIAEEVNITIKSKMKGIFADVKIIKAFGDITIYNKEKDEYNIKLSQFLSGISKNFVMEINVPIIKQKVGDLDRNQVLVQAVAMIKPLGGKQPIAINNNLTVTFMNQDEELAQVDADPDVMENFLRVKAVEVMKENIVLIEQRKFKEAQQNLKRIDLSIEKVKGVEKFEKVTKIRSDMNKLKQQCEMRDAVNAQRFVQEVERAHSREMNFAYQNQMQEEMVSYTKARKKR